MKDDKDVKCFGKCVDEKKAGIIKTIKNKAEY